MSDQMPLGKAWRERERARMALLDARATYVKTLALAGWVAALFVLVAAIAHHMAKVCR